jgi:hypothetical protein
MLRVLLLCFYPGLLVNLLKPWSGFPVFRHKAWHLYHLIWGLSEIVIFIHHPW